MRGLEIMRQLSEETVADHPFIRWWRPENDFVDYDLVAEFRTDLGKEEDYGGFELLTMQEMWDELKRVAGDRVSHYRKTISGDVIEWQHLEANGMQTDLFPYTAEAMLTIYDAETADNPLC